ncbi:uncharacterized protein SCHCODRAFT_02523536 [Schizophyllum commune H4-8]|uniref:uncharacterized protein n=1 Tax=Schizophyllum commune (strain H4-8 / FGSC 9210) TaxID=578458 RepID=UPI00215EF34F|nr:uncharacterized protein SCHCODRAFT_02523536 [Schizophyllum commune H4-8]KAI5899269.1 hypothetical protein SCHCODRAFT_02523536 [Schizophyllum commune H4-8]
MYPSVQALLDASLPFPDDPSVNDILHHNAALESSRQEDTIGKLLLQREAYLRSLTAEKRRLDEAMGLILKEINSIEAQCDVLRKSTTSPIRALPVDVLRAIFYLCVEPTVLDPAFECSVPPHMQSLLRLTHVCKWWRLIVHDMPTLWQWLVLTLRNLAHPEAHSCIEQWPVHASDLPLAYTICADPKDHPSWNLLSGRNALKALCSRAVSQLMRNQSQFPSHRLRVLYIMVPAQYLIPALSLLPPRAFPRLRSLQLYLPKRYSNETGRALPLTSPIRAFEDATRLTTLQLVMVIDETLADHLHLPWSSLTALTLHIQGPSCAFIAILQLCPRLIKLHIDERALKFPPNTHLGMLWDTLAGRGMRHDDLRTLSFKQTSTCLTSLDAPKLSNAELHGIIWHSARPLFVAFLQRASNITSLTLVDCDFSDSHNDGLPLMPMWRLLSQVEELVLDNCAFSVLMLVDELIVRSGETPVLPYLKDLRILELRGNPPCDPDLMVDKFAAMVESRMRPRPGVSPIRRVELWPRDQETFSPDFSLRVQDILGDSVKLVLP